MPTKLKYELLLEVQDNPSDNPTNILLGFFLRSFVLLWFCLEFNVI